jgi:hypothetical protein
MNLTFQVLKDDLIEKHGLIETALFGGSKDRAERALIDKIINNTNHKAPVVENAISDFINRGYIKASITDKGCQWHWA